MFNQHTRFNTLLLTGAAFLTLMSNAYAIEANQVAERLKTALANQNVNFSYETAHQNGKNIIIEGASAGSTESQTRAKFDTLILENVTEIDDGAYRVERLGIDTFAKSEDNIVLQLADLELLGIILPANPDTDPFGGFPRVDSIKLGTIDISNRELNLFNGHDFSARYMMENDGSIAWKIEMDRFEYNYKAKEDHSAQTLQSLKDLNLEIINGSWSTDGSWNPVTGKMTTPNLEAKLNNIGTLHLAFDFSGYSSELMRLTNQLSQNSESFDDLMSSQVQSLLAMAQKLTFNGLSIRFTDDNFVTKALNYGAKLNNTEAKSFVEMARSTIPAQLSPFVGEQIAADAGMAVGDFLENPKNIELRAMPAAPVPFMMFGAAFMGAPAMLMQQLGLKITANQ